MRYRQKTHEKDVKNQENADVNLLVCHFCICRYNNNTFKDTHFVFIHCIYCAFVLFGHDFLNV